MNILAIDPGHTVSAFVVWDGMKLLDYEIYDNETFIRSVIPQLEQQYSIQTTLIEMVASYGMPVGKEVFETVLWIGRMVQRSQSSNKKVELIYRKDVKIHHCHSMRAKDSNIRQALIDKYGAPGTKKNQGLTYGLRADLWSAFAIATYYTERLNGKQ